MARTPLNPFSKQRIAQRSGQVFEAYVKYAAMRSDVMAIQNGLRAKWVSGRLVPLRTSLLDFLLVNNDGRMAMVDAKQYQTKRFGVSRLEAHQRALSQELARRNAIAGFVVHLAEADAVIYVDARLFTGNMRQGFGAEDGAYLGTLKDFTLQPIFARRP